MFLDFFRAVPRQRNVKLNRNRGVIYHNPGRGKKLLFYIANISLVMAAVYLLYLYYPLGKAYLAYETKNNSQNSLNNQLVEVQEPVKDHVYRIIVPKILAEAKIATDISPFDRDEYLKVLSENVVAQAKGTAMPGEGKGKTTYIFAHSTQQGIGLVKNNSVFYLLGQLKNDDLVRLERNGEKYIYKVYMQKVINANQVEYLKYTDPEKELLILQTCWPIGTDWKRLLVFAERIER